MPNKSARRHHIATRPNTSERYPLILPTVLQIIGSLSAFVDTMFDFFRILELGCICAEVINYCPARVHTRGCNFKLQKGKADIRGALEPHKVYPWRIARVTLSADESA